MHDLRFAALIDAPSGALLTLSLRLPIIAFLAKTMPDAEPSWGVNCPNYLRSFPLADADPATFPSWTWNRQDRTFEPTSEALLTDRVRAASALAVRKSYALFEIIQSISTARNLLWSGTLMQETVDLTKRMQALQFQANGYPEDDLLRYPYVRQYAEAEGMPLRDAADEILFRAQLDDEVLAKTEGLRLKYLNLIGKAEIDAVEDVMKAFRGEMW